MNIQNLSSLSNTLSRGSFQPAQAQAPGLSRNDSTRSGGSGRGYSSADVFETALGKKKDAGPETAIRNSLAHAGVDQATSKAVMDAVRGGASLDSALQSAGVSPEQHRSVMESVRAQDPAHAGGGAGISGS
jgi:hypothetical protein